MIIESEIPQTDQGLILFIHYADNELKKNNRRNVNLADMIQECHKRLVQAGYCFLNNQWTKEKK